jgi:hypothetical protein
VVMVVVALAAVSVLWPYFKEWSPLVRKITVGAGGLAILFPLVVLHVYWPPYFDTTASSEKVEYEFKSMYCAAQFHAANYDDVIASEVPEQLVQMILNGGGEEEDGEDEEA